MTCWGCASSHLWRRAITSWRVCWSQTIYLALHHQHTHKRDLFFFIINVTMSPYNCWATTTTTTTTTNNYVCYQVSVQRLRPSPLLCQARLSNLRNVVSWISFKSLENLPCSLPCSCLRSSQTPTGRRCLRRWCRRTVEAPVHLNSDDVEEESEI